MDIVSDMNVVYVAVAHACMHECRERGYSNEADVVLCTQVRGMCIATMHACGVSNVL